MQLRLIHADERGSIIALSYGSATVTNINKYDEYGLPQSGNFGRFQYTGQMWLPEAGVYHYKARDYAPHLPRFLQADPVGYDAGANLYAYVGNDPVNFSDPLGLKAEDPQAVTPINPGECDVPAGSIPVCGRRENPNAPSESATLLSGAINGAGPAARTNESGNGGGAGQSKDKQHDKEIPCDLALQEGGPVLAVGLGFHFTPGAGATGSFGTWKDLRTGTHGDYVSFGAQVGLEIEGSGGGSLFNSLADFNGFNLNAHGSIPFFNGGMSFSTHLWPVGVSGAPGSAIGGGAGISVTRTKITQCKKK